ncbi:MAG TPA: hypothetical protein VM889_01350 [Candidatus Thermoplasmatota archaeon]|nr:hypothetical protein [Candidatus Thermoplasmatota archaeon]
MRTLAFPCRACGADVDSGVVDERAFDPAGRLAWAPALLVTCACDACGAVDEYRARDALGSFPAPPLASAGSVAPALGGGRLVHPLFSRR